jgi:hypothetical protein
VNELLIYATVVSLILAVVLAVARDVPILHVFATPDVDANEFLIAGLRFLVVVLVEVEVRPLLASLSGAKAGPLHCYWPTSGGASCGIYGSDDEATADNDMFVLFTLFAGGGGDVALGPHLVTPDIRLDERTVPLPFVLAFHNSGDEAATIKGVSAGVIGKTLISRTGDDIPDGFDYRVEYKEGHPTQIAAGADGLACGFIRWSLPEDPPPMLAIVRCSLRSISVSGRSARSPSP